MVTFDLFSDKGERPVNEDRIGYIEREGLFCFILADGLGGHGGGDRASALTVEVIQKYFEENGALTRACVESCICLAQDELLKLQEKEHKADAMKTTVVVLVTDGEKALWGHVGDSRLYHFIKKRKWERTKDHSLTQVMADLGEIREKDIRGHEDRCRLLHVLGSPWEDEQPYEITEPVKVDAKDCFLLCSDGFWELIEEKEMVRYLKKSASAADWLLQMKTHVEKAGKGTGMDNFSAAAIRV